MMLGPAGRVAAPLEILANLPTGTVRSRCKEAACLDSLPDLDAGLAPARLPTFHGPSSKASCERFMQMDGTGSRKLNEPETGSRPTGCVG